MINNSRLFHNYLNKEKRSFYSKLLYFLCIQNLIEILIYDVYKNNLGNKKIKAGFYCLTFSASHCCHQSTIHSPRVQKLWLYGNCLVEPSKELHQTASWHWQLLWVKGNNEKAMAFSKNFIGHPLKAFKFFEIFSRGKTFLFASRVTNIR